MRMSLSANSGRNEQISRALAGEDGGLPPPENHVYFLTFGSVLSGEVVRAARGSGSSASDDVVFFNSFRIFSWQVVVVHGSCLWI